jgi:hypothetical protein
VGTGTARSNLILNNTASIISQNFPNSGQSAATQIVVGLKGTVEVLRGVNNPNGFVSASGVPASAVESVGSIIVDPFSNYAIREPLHQYGSAAQLDIQFESTLELANSTGQDGTSTGTRGKSLFMEGGIIWLDFGQTVNAQPGKLKVDSGYQQDGGSLRCSGAFDLNGSNTWVVDASYNSQNKIIINGGWVEVGSQTSGAYGQLKLLVGNPYTNAVQWVQGTIKFVYNSPGKYSSVYADTGAVFGYQPGPPPSPPTFQWLGSAPAGVDYLLFADIFGIIVYQTPTEVNGNPWTSTFGGQGWHVQ